MKDKIFAIIVDDEQEAIDYLSILLEENCPQVEVVDTATQSEKGLQSIYRHHPDLVFLDIQIDEKNGFDMVDELTHQNHLPHVIFVTAYDRYAVEAFKANATDYLLKPVDKDELVRAVNKFVALAEKQIDLSSLQKLIGKSSNKIRFNTRTGYILVEPSEIIYCQADGNYTDIFLQDESKKTITCNLRSLIAQLPEASFKRISRFHLINEKYLTEVDKGKHWCRLKNGNQQIVLKYSPKLFFD